jgi:hypothetical protein
MTLKEKKTNIKENRKRKGDKKMERKEMPFS